MKEAVLSLDGLKLVMSMGKWKNEKRSQDFWTVVSQTL